MAGFTPITVTGTYEDANGKALTGTVTATPSSTIQNENKTVSPVAVKAKIVAGVLTGFVLKANDDSGTLPRGSSYTFKVQVAGSPLLEFKAIVKHEPSTIDISELYESSGLVGSSIRPDLSLKASGSQDIVSALGALGLVIVNP